MYNAGDKDVDECILYDFSFFDGGLLYLDTDG